MAISSSPYSNSSMHDLITMLIPEYLGMKESLVHFPCINRRHKKSIETDGLLYKVVEISSTIVNQLFGNIHKFPHLTDLHIHGCQYDPLQVVHGCGKVNRLFFYGDGISRLPILTVINLIEAIPNLKGLSFWYTGGVGLPQFQFSLQENLSNLAKVNLRHLSDLKMTNSNVEVKTIKELLHCAPNLRSVSLECEEVTDDIFQIFARMPSLTRLNISSTIGDAQFKILVGCHALETFIPNSEISEDDLLAVMQSNPHLTEIGISDRKNKILTDALKQAFASHCKKLARLLTSELGEDSIAIEKEMHKKKL